MPKKLSHDFYNKCIIVCIFYAFCCTITCRTPCILVHAVALNVRTNVSDIPSFRRNRRKNFPTKAIANHGGVTGVRRWILIHSSPFMHNTGVSVCHRKAPFSMFKDDSPSLTTAIQFFYKFRTIFFTCFYRCMAIHVEIYLWRTYARI